jgi:hypothetical protein
MLTHAPVYASEVKAGWRDYIYSILTHDNCHTLLDSNGNFPYRWLEPIGENAFPFQQILKTGRIKESQLIGIDRDPRNPGGSLLNIERCRSMFPQAEFHCEDWIDYCEGPFDHSGIGYIIMDIYVATKGRAFERTLEASLCLAEKSKKEIGEVLLVVNADFGRDKRFRNASKETYAQEMEKVFKAVSSIEGFKKIRIHPESVYVYKNPGRSSDMATIPVIL